MLIILRLAVLPHKHPHELLDSVVKERWLSLSSQPRRAFYSSTTSCQAVIFTKLKISFVTSTTCAFDQLLASRQREANSTAFQTTVNHLFNRFRSTRPKHRQDQTTTLSARRILRSFRCFATPLLILTSCFRISFPRSLRRKRCAL